MAGRVDLVARRALRQAAAGLDRVRRRSGLVVLIYHRVGAGSGLRVDLSVEHFDEQMAWLAEHHRPVDLDEAAGLLADGAEPPGPPPVAVTFDDGTADFVEHALPVLVRHRVPAALHVATRFVDEQLPFPDDGRPVSWAGLAEAVSTGLVTIGSHSHTHALFDRIDPGRAADDLDRSIELIGEHLGARPDHFAYPKAIGASAAVEPVVRDRFVTAAVAGTRPNPWDGTDLHRLRRSPVQVGDRGPWFARKAAGGLGLEDDVRSVIDRWRHRRARS